MSESPASSSPDVQAQGRTRSRNNNNGSSNNNNNNNHRQSGAQPRSRGRAGGQISPQNSSGASSGSRNGSGSNGAGAGAEEGAGEGEGAEKRSFSAALAQAAGISAGAPAKVPIVCPGHSRPVRQVAFSPDTADGVFMISSCLDGRAMLREGSSGDWIGSLVGHKGAVWCAQLDRTATVAATASADFTVGVWDATSGRQLHEWTDNHIVKSVAFADEDRVLLAGGRFGVLSRLDLSTLAEQPLFAWQKGAPISRVVVPPQLPSAGQGAAAGAGSHSSLALSSSEDEDVIKVWDARSPAPAQLLQMPGKVSDLQLTWDGSVIVASSGKTVRFFDSSSFNLIKSLDLSVDVDSVSYHPGSGKLVTGFAGELWAREWSFETGAELEVYKSHHGPVHCVAHHPVFQGAFATSSEDGTIRLWNYPKAEKTEDKEEDKATEKGGQATSADEQKDNEQAVAE